MVNEFYSNKVIGKAEKDKKFQDQGLDHKRAVTAVLGEKASYEEIDEIESTQCSDDAELIKNALRVLQGKELPENTAGCDIENAITEEIDLNSENNLSKIYNVAGIPSFDKIGISGFVTIDFLEKRQTAEPVIVTFKVIPEGYEYKKYTKSDLVIEAPNVNVRDNEKLSEKYWEKIESIVAKIMKQAHEKNKKHSKGKKRRVVR